MKTFMMIETIYHYVEAEDVEEAQRKFEEGHDDVNSKINEGDWEEN